MDTVQVRRAHGVVLDDSFYIAAMMNPVCQISNLRASVKSCHPVRVSVSTNLSVLTCDVSAVFAMRELGLLSPVQH